jgi:hypothetical protein
MKPSIIARVSIKQQLGGNFREGFTVEQLHSKSFGFNGSDSFFRARAEIYAWVDRVYPGAEIIDIEAEISFPLKDDSSEQEALNPNEDSTHE